MKNKRHMLLTYVTLNIPKEYFKWSLPYNYILNLKAKQLVFKNNGIWWLNEGSF